MAEYVRSAPETAPDRTQVETEKARVYRPVLQSADSGIGWKELQAGVCRVMQDYCGRDKSETVLLAGLEWLRSIEESEAARTYARNPHELWRTLEVMVRMTVGEMIMEASLARQESSQDLDFWRIDYPETASADSRRYILTRLEDGAVRTRELPLGFWLKEPYSADYAENYRLHSAP
jgi:succinate dehydrogenase/fumarate reductase flavoprotein subunit